MRRILSAGVAALLLWLAPPPALARDWVKQPAVVEIDTAADVYAVGDVHGDYDRLAALLTAAGLIPAAPDAPDAVRWKAGKAVLVCTGDLVDKGPASVKVVAFFRALQKAAEAEGGRVVVTMGNHEAEFLNDPSGDKTTDFAADLKAHDVKPEDVAAGTDSLGLGKWLRSLPMAARVNDTFFAHAGDTRGRTMTQLRSDLEEWVDAHGYLIGEDPDTPLWALLNARLHPYPWWQKSADEEATAGPARLAEWAKALGVKRFVLGHQPGKVKFSDGSQRAQGTVCAKFDGLLFLIDVGMSRQVDYSKGAVLHLAGGKVTVIYPDGAEKKVWPG